MGDPTEPAVNSFEASFQHVDTVVAGQQLAGLLALLYSCFDVKGMLGGKHPYVLYYLAAAMRPRMLMTVDAEGKLLPVSVRVGQAIDTVAQV